MGMVLALTVLTVEILLLGLSGSSLSRLVTKGAVADLVFFVIAESGGTTMLLGLSTFGLSTRVLQIAAGLPSLGLSPLLSFICYLLSTSFLAYWLHRAMHCRWLWPIHSWHHADAENMTLLTGYRAHPWQYLANALPDTMLLCIFGVPPWMIAAWAIVYPLHQMLTHSTLPWSFGWAGRWLIISPATHAIHHRSAGNFGFTLVIWDHLFSTWTSTTTA